MNIQIGDTVRVVLGMHLERTGKVISLRCDCPLKIKVQFNGEVKEVYRYQIIESK